MKMRGASLPNSMQKVQGGQGLDSSQWNSQGLPPCLAYSSLYFITKIRAGETPAWLATNGE